MSAISPGAEFQFEGQTLFLPRVIQADKKAFHRWANARALMELTELADAIREGDLSRDQYAKQEKATADAVTGGKLHFDEPLGRARFFTESGLVQMLYIGLHRKDDTIVRGLVERMAEANGTDWLLERYLEANADPNVKAPPTAKAGETQSTPPTSSTPT
jgi:hypothetical protein